MYVQGLDLILELAAYYSGKLNGCRKYGLAWNYRLDRTSSSKECKSVCVGRDPDGGG